MIVCLFMIQAYLKIPHLRKSAIDNNNVKQPTKNAACFLLYLFDSMSDLNKYEKFHIANIK